MYEAQNFLHSQDNSSNFGQDLKSWLSGDANSSPTQSSLAHSSTTTTHNSNVDRVLFKDLVEIVPLVQSLIDRKASSSFTRRGSVTYTKTPSRESLSKKVTEQKGRNPAQSIPIRKKRDHGDKDPSTNASNNPDSDIFSNFSSRTSAEQEELDALRVQVDDLQRKVSEKEELLKSSEISKDQMKAIQAKLDEMKHQVSEKDALIKAAKLQLSDAKIRLADKQAALEKLQWEAMTSNRKVEKLQEELDSLQGQISSFMFLFEGLMKADAIVYGEDYDISPCTVDHLPHIDDLDETQMRKMEEARKAYVTAVAAAKEKQDEESIAAAASARLHLQSLVL